jgi:hypothetical protein
MVRKLGLTLITVLLGQYALAGPGERLAKLKYDMWLEACLYTRYSCEGVPVPKIKYEGMRQGLYGYYDGGDTVFVNKNLWGSQRRATLFHEMVHYLQAKVGGLRVPGPSYDICMAEDEAFSETDDWWDRVGMPGKKRGNWWGPYRHCWQYIEEIEEKEWK